MIPDPGFGNHTDYCVMYIEFTCTQPIKMKVMLSSAHNNGTYREAQL
jgi:hypothetical protein